MPESQQSPSIADHNFSSTAEEMNNSVDANLNSHTQVEIKSAPTEVENSPAPGYLMNPPAPAGVPAPAKPVVVRIKRKRLQSPVESLWLEVSERPAKRPELGLGSLSLNDSEGQTSRTMGEARTTRLLFHHVETVASFGAEETTRVESLLKKACNEKKSMHAKCKERRQSLIKSKEKQDHHMTAAREMHESVARTARFEQVWRSRKGVDKVDTMRDFFHLYDVVRVDVEAEAAEKLSRQEQAKREAELAEGQLLRNYLPLLREYLPTSAAKLESEVSSQNNEQGCSDEYVYDVYALEEGADGHEADESGYPMVHIIDDDDFYCGLSSESEYDSEDSNDENNPINDYPEEEHESELEIESDAEDGLDESDSEEGDEESDEENENSDAKEDEAEKENSDYSEDSGHFYDSDEHDSDGEDSKKWLRRK